MLEGVSPISTARARPTYRAELSWQSKCTSLSRRLNFNHNLKKPLNHGAVSHLNWLQASGDVRALKPIHRFFAIMPFMHSESEADQQVQLSFPAYAMPSPSCEASALVNPAEIETPNVMSTLLLRSTDEKQAVCFHGHSTLFAGRSSTAIGSLHVHRCSLPGVIYKYYMHVDSFSDFYWSDVARRDASISWRLWQSMWHSWRASR